MAWFSPLKEAFSRQSKWSGFTARPSQIVSKLIFILRGYQIKRFNHHRE